MLPSKTDSFSDVVWGSGVNADYRHTPLLARITEGSVEVTGLDRAVGEGVRFPIGVFSGPGVVRAPDAVVPASEDVGAVPCAGRVVAWGGWRDRVDQRLRKL